MESLNGSYDTAGGKSGDRQKNLPTRLDPAVGCQLDFGRGLQHLQFAPQSHESMSCFLL
jgi:hypothetical protein